MRSECWMLQPILAREFAIEEKPLPVYLSREEGAVDLAHTLACLMRRVSELEMLNIELAEKKDRPAREQMEKVMKMLLPTLDGFERVLSLAREFPKSVEIDNWLKSVESIYYRLIKVLENLGLEQLNTVGSKVDLDIHEVVEYRPSNEHPHETVISERQKGYKFQGKLLREAKVVVAYNERRENAS